MISEEEIIKSFGHCIVCKKTFKDFEDKIYYIIVKYHIDDVFQIRGSMNPKIHLSTNRSPAINFCSKCYNENAGPRYEMPHVE